MDSPRLFELVTGTVRLDRMREFERLHRDVLLALLERHGIQPFILLFTEVGVIGRFFDLYAYAGMREYEDRTAAVLADAALPAYYEQIQPCLIGTIEIQLLRAFSYSPIV